MQAVKGSSLLPAIVPNNRGLVNVFTSKSAAIEETILLIYLTSEKLGQLK